jgi:hypothetical protein
LFIFVKKNRMKLRNNWKTINKQWDKIMIRFRISAVDLLNIEIDKSRNFYLITIFNITLKNR